MNLVYTTRKNIGIRQHADVTDDIVYLVNAIDKWRSGEGDEQQNSETIKIITIRMGGYRSANQELRRLEDLTGDGFSEYCLSENEAVILRLT